LPEGGSCTARQTVILHPLIAATILAGVMVGVLGTYLVAERDEAEGSGDMASEAESAIFVMGDGMGQAHRDAILLATVGPYGRLEMDKLPVEGMVDTNTTDPDEIVTDSAAGATSFATGVKTHNGAIGVDEEGREVATIVERAKAAGKSVGLVTTSQLTDASPAAFASHVEDRARQSQIARQYIEETEVDVILGGGKVHWYPPGANDVQPGGRSVNAVEGARGSKGNLVMRATDLGYEYVTNPEELEQVDGEKVLALFANEKMFQPGSEGGGAAYEPPCRCR
jgi:alkaline phosphatase